jgi:hypothetical protein
VGGEASDAEACLYVISCGLERAKIGVAGGARKRLRELQLGSPLELKLALSRPYLDRRDAEAVSEELYRCFAGRVVGSQTEADIIPSPHTQTASSVTAPPISKARSRGSCRLSTKTRQLRTNATAMCGPLYVRRRLTSDLYAARASEAGRRRDHGTVTTGGGCDTRGMSRGLRYRS